MHKVNLIKTIFRFDFCFSVNSINLINFNILINIAKQYLIL